MKTCPALWLALYAAPALVRRALAADTENNLIRKLTVATGRLTVVVGTAVANVGGTVGSSGDGGPATSATINHPIGMAIDGTGALLFADKYVANQELLPLRHAC
jgi:hypothetical protein